MPLMKCQSTWNRRVCYLTSPTKSLGFPAKHFLSRGLSPCSPGIQERDVKIKGMAAKSVASAIMCRVRYSKGIALHYRISKVLFHSGAKLEDLVRLNHLGVCMSPKCILNGTNLKQICHGIFCTMWKVTNKTLGSQLGKINALNYNALWIAKT